MTLEENEKETEEELGDAFDSVPGYLDYEDEPVSGGNYTLDDIENFDDGLNNIVEELNVGGDVNSSPPEQSAEAQIPASQIILERDSYLETLRKVQADFENYKKRVVRDTQEFSEAKSVKLISDLLGVLDNFELALNSFDDDEQDEKILKLKKGIDLVYSDFYSALEKQGLEKIEAKGEAFDPEYHEAVLHEEAGDSEIESVVEVLRPGYSVRGKVIRPAMVKVSK